MWWLSYLYTSVAFHIMVAYACEETGPADFAPPLLLLRGKPPNESRASSTYDPQINSFLVYMMELTFNETYLRKNCTKNVLCAISKYHQLVCEYICNQRSANRKQQRQNDKNSHYRQISQLFCTHQTMPGKSFDLQLMEYIVEDMSFCPVFVIPYWTTNNRGVCEKLCRNSSPVFEFMSECCIAAFYIHIILDVCLLLFICAMNCFILMFHCKTSHFQTICGHFIVSLAIADLTVGTVIVPFIIYTFYVKYMSPVGKPYQTNTFGVNVIGFFTAASLTASLLTLLCSATFRYIAVAKPEIYSSQQNRFNRLSRQCIIGCWIAASAIGLGPIVLPFDEYYTHAMGMTLSRKMDKLFLYQAILVISLVLLWGISGATYLAFKREQIQMRNVITHCTPKSRNQSVTAYRRREKSVAKVLTFIFSAFTACYLPLIVTQSFSTIKSISLDQHPEDFDATVNMVWNICMFFASRLVCLNSATNGLVLYFGHRKFRQFVKSYLPLPRRS